MEICPLVTSTAMSTQALEVVDPLGPLLTVEEEREVVALRCEKLQRLCRAFTPALPDSVIGTATAYLQRYYLSNTVMGLPPDDVAHLCVFAACKTEEANISLAGLASLLPDPPAAVAFIKRQELALLSELRFQLTVHSPFRPLRGLLADARDDLLNGDGAVPVLEAVWAGVADAARHRLLWYLLSDAPLLFPPSQLALAALLHACDGAGADAEPYLRTLARRGPQGKSAAQFRERARAVEQAAGRSFFIPVPTGRAEVGHGLSRRYRC